MAYEGIHNEPARITRSEITPLGPEIEVNDNGMIFTVRPYKGNLTIVSHRDKMPSLEKLAPATIRAIEKALEGLKEQI